MALVAEPHTRAYSRIVYHFGPEILLENGEIDRQKLGQLIFANEEKRKLLNSITHPEIHKAMLKEILYYFLRGERRDVGLAQLSEKGKMIYGKRAKAVLQRCSELYFIGQEVKVTEIRSAVFAAHSHSLHFPQHHKMAQLP